MQEYLKKALGVLNKPLPSWIIILFLIIIFTNAILQEYLSDTIFDLLKFALALCIGAGVNQYGNSKAEKTKNKNAMLTNAYEVIQALSQQYIHLVNLKKETETRGNLIKKIFNEDKQIPRAEMMLVTQDYREDLIRIERKALSSILPDSVDDVPQYLEATHLVYLADRSYHKALMTLLEINEAKRSILPNTNGQSEFLSFLDRNIPSMLEIIEQSLDSNRRALKAFQKEIKVLFGKKYKVIEYGEIFLVSTPQSEANI